MDFLVIKRQLCLAGNCDQPVALAGRQLQLQLKLQFWLAVLAGGCARPAGAGADF